MTDQYMSGERQVDGNEMENISKYSSPEQNEHCQKKIYQSGNVKADLYVDIRHLPHHESKTHPRMPRANRAAQFMPFSALSGYEEAVQETARQTEQFRELDEDSRRRLDETG